MTTSTGKLKNQLITENIKKTVAADGELSPENFDFVGITEAIAWVNSSSLTNGYIWLELSPGVHSILPDADGNLFHMVDKYVYIASADYVKETCTVTLDSNNTFDLYKTIFKTENCNLYLDYLTIDPSLGGYVNAGKISGVTGINSYISLYEVDIKSSVIPMWMGINTNIGSSYYIGNVSIDNCLRGINALFPVQATVLNIAISNATTGIQVEDTDMTLYGYTFTSNTTDTNIPLNEIQQTGAFISDDTKPLYSDGTTTSISVPTTIYVETTGSDVTGDGSVSLPFATPHKALEYLSDKTLVEEVTIQIGTGDFVFTESITINHPYANKIKIIGNGLSGVRPAGNWYVPVDGVYPGIGATDKYLVTERPTDYNVGIRGDEAINISLIKDRFNTTLTFNGCHGFVIEGVDLLNLDSLGIIGDYTGSTSGINVGQTVSSGKVIPNSGGITLGSGPWDADVVVCNFGSAGYNADGQSYIRTANAIAVQCNTGFRAKVGSMHTEAVEAYNCTYGVLSSESGVANLGSDPTIAGCYTAIVNWNGGATNIGIKDVRGNYHIIHIDMVEVWLYMKDGAVQGDNKHFMQSTQSTVTILMDSAFTPATVWTDTAIFSRFYDTTLSFDGNTGTDQQIIDMNWGRPVNVMGDNASSIRTFNGYMQHYVPKPEAETALATYTPDFQTSDYFEYTLDQNSIIDNPINLLKAHRGNINIKQDATGGWTPTFGSTFVHVGGVPTINTAANAVNVFEYNVTDSTHVVLKYVIDYI